MTKKEAVLKIRPQAFAHDTGTSIVIRDPVAHQTLARCPIRRESWAWALALECLMLEADRQRREK